MRGLRLFSAVVSLLGLVFVLGALFMMPMVDMNREKQGDGVVEANTLTSYFLGYRRVYTCEYLGADYPDDDSLWDSLTRDPDDVFHRWECPEVVILHEWDNLAGVIQRTESPLHPGEKASVWPGVTTLDQIETGAYFARKVSKLIEFLVGILLLLGTYLFQRHND